MSSADIANVSKTEGLVPERVLDRLLDAVSIKKAGGSEVEVIVKRMKADEGPEDGKAGTDRGAEMQESGVARNQKSTRSDDAEVPTYLWDLVLNEGGDKRKTSALEVIRSGTLRWCKRRLRREFLMWFFQKYPHLCIPWKDGGGSWGPQYRAWIRRVMEGMLGRQEVQKDWLAGRECVARYSNSSWWEWPDGSRPHFWRWPAEYRRQIRDGVKPWFRAKVPSWKVPQRAEKDVVVWKAMKAKLDKVKRLRYICPGQVDSLTSFFAVPKGDSDVRMVYDGTKSGLNDSMWAPWFSLPTIEAHLRFVSDTTFLSDLDIGDMFHNFLLHEKVQRLAGIDVTTFFPEEVECKDGKKTLWLRWV